MRRAGLDETGQVLAVLDEAAAWLAARGVRQWPPRSQREWIEAAVRDGYTWLATAADGGVLARAERSVPTGGGDRDRGARDDNGGKIT